MKCRYHHEKDKKDGGKLKGVNPEQQKLVTTLLSSAMKRTAVAIAKKSKKPKTKVKNFTNEKEGLRVITQTMNQC